MVSKFHSRTRLLVGAALIASGFSAPGCQSSNGGAAGSGGTGGSVGSGGAASLGGATGGTGGVKGSGGAAGTGGAGAVGTGGAIGTGGATSNGGAAGSGTGGSVVTGTGGSLGSGGKGGGGATGGASGGGGAIVTGGAAGAGTGGIVVKGTGGVPASGGATGVGGSSIDGGAGTAGPVDGTVSIFDGKTLNGWEQGTPALFSVVNGVIDGKGTTGGALLMTQADYGDFRVIVSSNMVATGGSGHLGICFWGGRTPIGQYNNCKLIIPPGGGAVGNNLYDWDYSLNAALNSTTVTGNPTYNATWNTLEILCFLAKGFCRIALNGTAAKTYQEAKLSSIKAGPIGLQIHNGTNEEVQYKDVFVDPAPTVDQLLTVK